MKETNEKRDQKQNIFIGPIICVEQMESLHLLAIYDLPVTYIHSHKMGIITDGGGGGVNRTYIWNESGCHPSAYRDAQHALSSVGG